MGTEGRNYSGEIAHLRDTFLKYEKDYLKELLADSKNLEKVDRFKSAPLKEVIKYVKRLMNSMDMGIHTYPDGRQAVIDESLAENLEREICLALYSIEDAVLVKDKVKTMDREDDGGFSR